MTARVLLDGLFRTAIAAAHPSSCLPPHLPTPPTSGRLIVLAAGKAAGAMTEVAEQHYLDRGKFAPERLIGVAVARHGYGRPSRRIEMIEAGHPVPDAAGLAAAEKALRMADEATADDLVLVLLSGGASANWIAPVDGLSFADKQTVTRALLRSGANIGEMNTLRKHLSRIKGGRLARRAQPARVITLAISDVPGDEPAVIGSGPTVPDPTTLDDARSIVARYRLDLPEAATRVLNDPNNESPKPGDPMFANTEYRLIAKPADAFRAVESSAQKAGYETVMLGDRVQGEGMTFPIPTRYRSGMDGASKLVAGFRPEHLELGELPNSATIRAKADVVEFLGDQELLHVTVQGHEGDVVAVVGSDNRVKPGDIIDLKLPLEKLHLFNQESGDSIAWSSTAAAA